MQFVYGGVICAIRNVCYEKCMLLGMYMYENVYHIQVSPCVWRLVPRTWRQGCVYWHVVTLAPRHSTSHKQMQCRVFRPCWIPYRLVCLVVSTGNNKEEQHHPACITI